MMTESDKERIARIENVHCPACYGTRKIRVMEPDRVRDIGEPVFFSDRATPAQGTIIETGTLVELPCHHCEDREWLIAKLREYEKDSQRLDALQRQIFTGTIVWDGVGDFPCNIAHRDGIGLIERDLRKAIDRCCLRSAIAEEKTNVED